MIMLDAAQLQLNYGLQHSMGCWVRSLRLQDHKVNNTEFFAPCKQSMPSLSAWNAEASQKGALLHHIELLRQHNA